MFGWLKNLFARRTAPPERFLFRYRDGVRTKSCDPLAAERTLAAVLGDDWRGVVRRLNDKPPMGLVGETADEWQAEAAKRRDRVLDAVCRAFSVERYTDPGDAPPRGLTEVELLGLLTGYTLYCVELVERARPFSTPRSRASPSPAPPNRTSGAA